MTVAEIREAIKNLPDDAIISHYSIEETGFEPVVLGSAELEEYTDEQGTYYTLVIY